MTSLSSGTRRGPYEILSPIGAGGMGEVYKARDTRLDRTVAVKVLPADFATSAQLRLRFEREAKAISQLAHPNICTLYDVGDDYLVMELLDGESLADRLERGPLTLPETLRYGAQIADALAQAHRAGIVHRDLKPGNVMITKTGAKLLDFGLAKTSAAAIDFDGATQQKSLTTEGTILGTFQYMAPEQLEGIEADARTDIFALGTVLYEMTTGRRAFEGKTKTSLIAAIVSGTPKPLTAVQPVTPASFEHIVSKCLEKDPELRWQSAADVAEELRWVASQPASAPAVVRRAGNSRAGWIAAALIAMVALGAIGYLMRPKPARVVYSEMNAPADTAFFFDSGAAIISPDGTMIVFCAAPAGGMPSLWIRFLDGTPSKQLKGTDNAAYPFWSPDSKSIGFFADAKLKKLDVGSGTLETITDASSGRGGAWNAENTIIFSPSPADGIFKVSASGGTPQQITSLDPNRGDSSHRFPVFAGDGRHFFAFIQGPSEGGNLLLGSIDSKEAKIVGGADGAVVFVAPDILLMVRDRVLRAQRLNTKTWAVKGDPVTLAEDVQVSSTFNFTNMSASRNGILTYAVGLSATTAEFVIVDSAGKRIAPVGAVADQLDPRMSPDGSTVVGSVNAVGSGTSDIWAFDLKRNVSTRLTFSPANDFAGVFSPDGKSIAYSTFDKRPGDIFVKRIDGTGNGDPLVVDRRRKVSTDWTQDGKYIIYNVVNPKTVWDIEAFSLADRKIISLVNGPTSEVQGTVSPDGKWLAYTTMETGHNEVFVQRFLVGGARWQISGGGGISPRWARDGKHLYFIAPDSKLMQAAVREEGDRFVAETPQPLFATGIRMLSGVTRSQYDVAGDGRFLINVASSEARRPAALTIVQNWTQKLHPQ